MSMYGVTETRIASGKGRAKQSMKDECNVNLIVANFVKTGMINHIQKGLPVFADVSEMTDYRTAIETVRGVEEYFAGLPAVVRARFENDAVGFMEYLESGADEKDLQALGLEVLGDRRKRSRDAREGDEVVPEVVPDVEPPPEPAPEAVGTLPT